MLNIHRARLEDASIIHRLAHQIYFPTYKGILTPNQMEFMLEKSYSIEALQQSMQNDQDFYIAYYHHKPIGFIGLKIKDSQILRIEKLYLLPETQGRGVGNGLINFAISQAKEMNRSILELNVNRGNKAYYFYLKMNFKVVQEIDIPYYGYVLDDYVMQLCL
ncbi:GNAT family N-acetyltransferase [Sphingobacterium bovistauri]|uniref:GNAT family N-acetyltransferase n=1 Tax=Sphingobacterium bovistauri TaxID=2781959 RepID=A0ABS7Z7G9_9SPHI|nr:GNAT family N-acetyltransferase [Sphingobacterium bovistauri]MCA5005366.1 GNAT family N-acetyltransferase [Sphingobacterium bovistauri]